MRGPTEDLSKYRLVFAPSLHLLSAGEADRLKLYVQNGGTLVGTCNTGLVDEHHIAPDTGYPHNLTDLFGHGSAGVRHVAARRGKSSHVQRLVPHEPPASGAHLVRPHRAEGLPGAGDLREGFLRGPPGDDAATPFGLGKAVYVGTMSHQHFYNDLVVWLRQLCNLHPLLKVPENVEVSLRQTDDTKIFFLLNHQNTPVRIQFYKPMHDFLTGTTFSGNYDLPPHGVLVLDEHPEAKPRPRPNPPLIGRGLCILILLLHLNPRRD